MMLRFAKSSGLAMRASRRRSYLKAENGDGRLDSSERRATTRISSTVRGSAL